MNLLNTFFVGFLGGLGKITTTRLIYVNNCVDLS